MGSSLLPSTLAQTTTTVDFYRCDVHKPIIGADFLRHFGLLVDIKQHQLIDATTRLHIQSILSTDPSLTLSICPKNTSHPYYTQVSTPDTPVKHDTVHHIETTGARVSAHPRSLAPDRLRAAKQEFEHMLQLGIIRPSSSAWSLPLHMVPKRTPGDWHLCGDYCALNRATAPDCYLVPHIHDFSYRCKVPPSFRNLI